MIVCVKESIQELFDRNLLDLRWFHSQLEELRDKVCDISSVRRLPSTRYMRLQPIVKNEHFFSRKEIWRGVMEDESYSQVVRDISSLDY